MSSLKVYDLLQLHQTNESVQESIAQLQNFSAHLEIVPFHSMLNDKT